MAKKEEDNGAPQVDLGQLFYEAREAIGVSLKEAHFSTQLSVEVLEHIESNQFVEIGASVYVRGYLGIYAKYLGLDAKRIVDIYESQNATTRIEIRPSIAQSINTRKLRSKRHSKALSSFVVIAVLVGLGYGYYLLKPLLFPTVEQPVAELLELDTDIENSNSTLNNLLSEADTTLNSANDAMSNNAINSGANSLTQEVEVDINSFLAEGARLNSNTTESDLAEQQTSPPDLMLESDTETVQSELTEEIDNQEKSLSITFSQDCWVKITDKDGNVLASRLYVKGSELNVSGMPPLALTIGNLDGVGTVLYDGQSITITDFKTGNISYTLD